jgi:N-acetylneuraminate synthase
MTGNNIFENLFILELANNHWGDLERGKKIVREFAKIVRNNNIKAAIKLQFRDVDNFIHKDFKNDGEGSDLMDLSKRSRYIQKTAKTKLSYDEFKELIEYIRNHNCIPMATPFDEKSVEWCVAMNLPIIKVASSDINDWLLLHQIAKTKKPVVVSSGGANDKQIEDVIKFFTNRNIPISLNHCVSKYPSEDYELELNQIDYLKTKFPNLVIGLSTHEYHDWHSSMYISYAKGARTWERHIDIPYPKGHEQKEVSKYCSLPHQVDEWFKAFNRAKIMCGTAGDERRIIDEKEDLYLKSLYRGLYLKRDMKKGEIISVDNLYSAIPYQKEIDQITSREYFDKEYELNKDLAKDSPLTKNDVI